MSGNSEEFRSQLDTLVKPAAAGDGDLEDIKAALDDASDRIDAIQQAWGDR